MAKQLRANPTTATIPIIMLTALGGKKHRQAALFKLGVEYYVVKPFEMDDLSDKVDLAIRHRIAPDA